MMSNNDNMDCVDTGSIIGTLLSYSDLPGYLPGMEIMKYVDSSDSSMHNEDISVDHSRWIEVC